MIPIQPIGPGPPGVPPPERSKRVGRAPKRERDEARPGNRRHPEDAADGDENELDGEDEAPHIDLRA